jgi:Dihydrouridine synthase (Dus)
MTDDASKRASTYPPRLQGQPSEWALLKRHASEDCFGVQICAAYPDMAARCVQLLDDCCSVDFIDINCGCPIDLVRSTGDILHRIHASGTCHCECYTCHMEQHACAEFGEPALCTALTTWTFLSQEVCHVLALLPQLCTYHSL